jgi:hypothetical protein
VSGRRSKEREDGVADVLLDRSAVFGDLDAHHPERVTQEAPRAFRPKPDRGIRRTHDVDEEASDQPDFTVGVHVASIVACGWMRFYMLVTPRV